MDLAAAGLREQPFRTHGGPLATISYAAQRDAMQMLDATCKSPHGLALLQGPSLSGKSTLIRQFVESAPEDCSVAVVDGKSMNTAGLLEAILRQFGYELDCNSTNELFAMLRVFVMQQASSSEPPLLIVENTHDINPSALRALCELASLKVRKSASLFPSAVKMILVSDRSLQPVIKTPAMKPISKRVTADFHLHPMTNDETTRYVHKKLRAAGSAVPEYVFPASVCRDLWEASGGWPGILDRVALLSLAKADVLPVPGSQVERPALPIGTWDESLVEQTAGKAPAPPRLIVSQSGKIMKELTFEQPRLLVGRSEHNDIAISSNFVSRHHLLLVKHGSSTFLMDLNSTNGSLVNSRRVSNHVLVHNDVISIGHHRIKFLDPHATKRGSLEGTEFADTAIMKTLEDMRNLLAQENTEIMPAATENLPTEHI